VAVIVHPSESIDSALKRLQREVLREKILETYRAKAFRVKEASLDAEKRRAYKKTKTRRRRASRKAK